MTALVNAHNLRGKPEPPHAGPTSCVSPEAQSSNTGVSSDFVPKPNHRWFVLRTRYGRELKAKRLLLEAGVDTYVAMKYAKKMKNGNVKRTKVPMIPNIVFVYCTRETLNTVVKKPSPPSEIVKLYLNKTAPPESNGLHPPVEVNPPIMSNFIKATLIDNKHTMMVNPNQCHFKGGDKVRVIDGEFKGVVGRVARVSGQQRVIIEIDNVGLLATAYIPSACLEIIKKQSNT